MHFEVEPADVSLVGKREGVLKDVKRKIIITILYGLASAIIVSFAFFGKMFTMLPRH